MSEAHLSHDPGGKHRWPILPGMRGNAVFSEDGKRRTILTRSWGNESPCRFALWIGMNPSVARGDVDDPTVRREVTTTRDRLGLGAYVKANIMDYRATDPAALLAVDQPCSPENLRTIRHFAAQAEIIIAAWGTLPPRLRVHATRTTAILREIGKPVFCLATTKDGSPRHGRGVKIAPLIPFDLGGGNV